ncbi:unnamed protein product [Rotaria sp. Silwood2]|nr:unnamed protein product [Rotaria sp. Silwood2]
MDEITFNTPSIIKLGSFAGKIKYCLIDTYFIPFLKIFKLKINYINNQLIVVANDGLKDIPLHDFICLRIELRKLNTNSLTLLIYTTCIKLTVENVFVHIENSKKIVILIYIDGHIHTIAIDLFELITNDFTVRISSNSRSQIEIDLNKQVDQMWKSIGKFLPNHLSICTIQDFEPIYFTTTLIKRTPVTHDTDWYTFSLPSNIFMLPPIGYHIRLRQPKDGCIEFFLCIFIYLLFLSLFHSGIIIVKPYTVVKRLNDEQNSSSEHTIELLVKHYRDGIMSTTLQKLNISDTIDMSSYEGTFDIQRIDMCQTLILIAAGTGFTPMIRIINYVIKQTNNGKHINVFLLFFNKTEKDILCREELETISKQYKLIVHYILSEPDTEWTGETGYIRGELLHRLLPSSPSKDHDTQTLVCICGPAPFTALAVDLFKEQNYNDNHLHVFLA